MKKSLLLALTLLCISSLAMAQAGSVGIFMDAAGLNCNLNNAAGFAQFHCVHVNSPGATACQFSVQVVGTPLTFIGQMSAYNLIGTAPFGVAVAYGMCKVSPIDALTATYMGVSAPCNMIKIVADPTAVPPGIYMTDCVTPIPNLLIATGGTGYVNNNGPCPCNVPDEDTSWGQIKALYQ